MAKFSLDYKQVGELMDKFQKLGGDTKKIAEDCLNLIPKEINPNLRSDIAKHRRTGRTEKSLVENPTVKWDTPLIASIDVGFNLKKGGVPSIFLMYGTPKHTPLNQYGSPKRSGAKVNPGIKQDVNLYNDIYGKEVKEKITSEQQKILTQAIEEAMKG